MPRAQEALGRRAPERRCDPFPFRRSGLGSESADRTALRAWIAKLAEREVFPAYPESERSEQRRASDHERDASTVQDLASLITRARGAIDD